jgi:putative transposase
MPRPRKPADPFRYFHSSPEVIRLVVMMYVCFPLSLRNVEDLLFERGIDLCHETVRLWWNRAPTGHPHAGLPAVEVASRRDVCEAQWRDGLPVAGGRPRGRDPREFRHEETGQIRGSRLHEEGTETPRSAREIVTDGLRSYPAAMRDSATSTGARPVAGRTIGWKTVTCRSDDENARCCGSGK